MVEIWALTIQASILRRVALAHLVVSVSFGLFLNDA